MTAKTKLWLAALLIEVAWLSLLPLDDLSGANMPRVLFAVGVAVLGLLVALRERRALTGSMLWGFGLLFRVTLWLTSPPTLSDDVYRYLWDGHLLRSGANTYLYAVNDPALDAYTIPARVLVNFPWMATPYLPAASALFALFGWTPLTLQIVMSVIDLGVGWLLIRLLERLGRPWQDTVLYLWHPLVVLEFAHGAHLDAWMIFLALGAFWLLAYGKKTLSVVALALSALTKGVSGVLGVVLWKRWGLGRSALFFGIIFAVLWPFALGAGWGLGGDLYTGTGVFGAIRIYNADWEFNAGFYSAAKAALGAHDARLVGAGLFGLVLLTTLWHAGREDKLDGLLRLALIPAGAFVLLSPTVHPWYATLLLPWLVFWMDAKENSARLIFWALLWVTLSVPLSYLAYLEPAEFDDLAWVRMLIHIPPWVGLGAAFFIRLVRRPASVR